MGRGRSKIAGGNGGGYTEFTDEPMGTHEYHGDWSDEEIFFNNNSNHFEIVTDIGYDDQAAYSFKIWSNGYWMDGSMYAGFDNLSEHDKRMVQYYDKYIDRSRLDKGIVVTRLADAQLVLGEGNKKPSLSKLKAKEGEIITVKANMSFAAAKHGLTIGQKGKSVEYRLHIAGGTKGAGLWIGDFRVNDWGGRQREFMTNRDMALKVGKTKYDRDRKKYVTDIYFVASLDHDYGTSGPIPFF